MSTSLHDDAAEIRRRLENDLSNPVRIALVGQPGAGKSSLINAIIGQRLAEVSQRTDTTVQAQCYTWEGVELWDLPGYGTSKFPPNSFIQEFRVDKFDLYLCVFSGKLTNSDDGIFVQTVRNSGKPFLYVRTKVDELWEEGKSTEELKDIIRRDVLTLNNTPDAHIVFTSIRPDAKAASINELQEQIRLRLDPAKQERFVLGAAALSVEALDRKFKAAEKQVGKYAAIAAANGLNPIPGVNAAVDAGVIIQCFASIRNSFGISAEDISNPSYTPFLGPALRTLGGTITVEALTQFLARFAGKQFTSMVARFIPLVGSLIAGTIGYGIVTAAGSSYVKECYDAAKAILNAKITTNR